MILSELRIFKVRPTNIIHCKRWSGTNFEHSYRVWYSKVSQNNIAKKKIKEDNIVPKEDRYIYLITSFTSMPTKLVFL